MTATLKMSEADLQRAVVEMAHLCGWRVAHFRTSRTADGRHLTAVAADAKGWPDLTMAHPAYGIVFVELKSDTGRLSQAQERWKHWIMMAGGRWMLWRPDDIRSGHIERVLTGRLREDTR